MSLHPPVLFVGDRPTKRNQSPDVAFVGTGSYKTLLSWMATMNVDVSRVYLVNAYDIDGKANDSIYGLNVHWRKVALGVNADRRLRELSRRVSPLEWFTLPHPSGLNRTLNDKSKLLAKLEQCRCFIYY